MRDFGVVRVRTSSTQRITWSVTLALVDRIPSPGVCFRQVIDKVMRTAIGTFAPRRLDDISVIGGSTEPNRKRGSPLNDGFVINCLICHMKHHSLSSVGIARRIAAEGQQVGTAAANRGTIVEVEGNVREERLGGIGVGRSMKRAGLTHGGFTVTSGRRTIFAAEAAAAPMPQNIRKVGRLAV